MNDLTRPATLTLHEEASRYALLRRLTPTLRHHMAGEFQPIGMMAALLERRVQNPNPDLANLKENCVSIGNLSRHAAETCASLMSWVAPRSPSDVAVSAGIAECVNLLSTSLRFRGFVLSNTAPEIDARVACTAIRSVLTAALLALSDGARDPADLQVSAQLEGGQVHIDLGLQTVTDRPADNRPSDEYRALTWHDVEALAAAEGVGLRRDGAAVRLTLTPRTA